MITFEKTRESRQNGMIFTRMSKEEVARLDRIAAEQRSSRSEVVRVLLREGMRQFLREQQTLAAQDPGAGAGS